MFAPIEPFASGLLEVGDGNRLYWETAGNPEGRAAVHLHGGPGSGMGAGYRRRFDSERYLIVGFEQRGCGRSRPLVTDDLSSLATQTTDRLVADMEQLRTHLGLERWLVAGVSWGTTLAVAYALAHPDRVTAAVLAAVGLTTRLSVDWITEAVGLVFPREWQRFERASRRRPGERVVEAYARLLTDPDAAVRRSAAADWCAWEGAHLSLGAGQDGSPLFADEPKTQAIFATLVTHYWSHDGFLPPDALASVAGLAGIPAVLIHGRYDVSGPLGFAFELHRAWPGSELIVVEDEGHGGPQMMDLMADATTRLLGG